MSYQDARILSPLDTIEVLPTSRKLHSVFNGVLDDDSDEDDIEELTGLPNERNKDLFIHSTRKLRDERRPLGQRLAAAQFINKLLTQEGGRSKLSLLTRSFDD
ncbi:hypothetical protein BCR33DRAFT_324854 [Rhizoclosmatium globosum]|uniref:Uncharacterized protein n=1 Tax=Rhizoclosmatium globosum TaxID=329046 RepID=A0A1Y2D041_9FUNG|nr:hypothetical protein BCR33DRAFT_324854 [Rhizoclosmatium globosum]|eukprot:ORY52643.1 hypothetical protein BCR33DRAFT_324854 [Rhizoclosmatium globosum]